MLKDTRLKITELVQTIYIIHMLNDWRLEVIKVINNVNNALFDLENVRTFLMTYQECRGTRSYFICFYSMVYIL